MIPPWVRHDFTDVCVFVFFCSALNNFMPRITWVDRITARLIPQAVGPVHDFYVWLVDMVAFCSLNFRAQIPSLDFQWFGFARQVKHSYRNWRQNRVDRGI